MRHFISLFELTEHELIDLLREAHRLKKAHARGKNKPLLAGKALGLIFEKPSLRTRVSFQAAVAQLGGSSIFMTGSEAGFNGRETLPDCARTLSQFVDAIVLRTFSQDTVDSFAQCSTKPVINGLSDYYHPCQALGDLLTMQEEFGDDLSGRTVVFVGDGNNVARSLAIGCGKLGIRFVLAAPKGYHFDTAFLQALRRDVPDADVVQTEEPRKAVKEADVIYTDVWTSMGQEEESERRRKAFAAFQVNEELLARAPDTVRVMHCLPAHRGEEITSGVLDGPRSVVFPQAGNRMHAQKALLYWLLCGQKKTAGARR